MSKPQIISTKPPLHVGVIFTGTPPVNMQSVSHVLSTAWRTREISTLHGGLMRNVPDVCKNSQVFPATVWQTLAQFSMQLLGNFKYYLAACRLFAKYADKQLAGKCQSYPQKWSTTVSIISFCWLGNVRAIKAIHKWSPTGQWFHFAGWEMSKLSTKVIPHSVNDFILLAGKCQSYPQRWSTTVLAI